MGPLLDEDGDFVVQRPAYDQLVLSLREDNEIIKRSIGIKNVSIKSFGKSFIKRTCWMFYVFFNYNYLGFWFCFCCLFFFLHLFIIPRSFSNRCFHLPIRFKNKKLFLAFVIFIIGKYVEVSQCKQCHDLCFVYEKRIISSVLSFELDKCHSNFYWVIEMPYWSITNIEDRKKNWI